MRPLSSWYLTRTGRPAISPVGPAPALVVLAAAVALTFACIIPPGDAEQIRTLIRDRETALARNDAEALYRLHDLDFRSICPLDRFRSLPRQPEDVHATRDLRIRGSRAWATLDLAAEGERSERLDFVKDAGRWYLYEGTEECLRSSGFRVPGSELAAGYPSPVTRHPSPVTAMTVTHG